MIINCELSPTTIKRNGPVPGVQQRWSTRRITNHHTFTRPHQPSVQPSDSSQALHVQLQLISRYQQTNGRGGCYPTGRRFPARLLPGSLWSLLISHPRLSVVRIYCNMPPFPISEQTGFELPSVIASQFLRMGTTYSKPAATPSEKTVSSFAPVYADDESPQSRMPSPS